MKKISFKFKNKFTGIPSFSKINPHKHWAILLRGFFVLVIFLILLSFYLLYKIRNEQIFQTKVDQGDKQTLLKEDLLKSTIETYDQKSRKRNEIESGGAIYKDPSI